MPELKSRLVQRLQAPRGEDKLAKVVEAFSFGGGGGRLKPEAMDMLRPIFSFDYMGAAEYEFGSLPESLGNIARNVKLYGCYEFTIPAKDIKPSWERERKERLLREAELEAAERAKKKPKRINHGALAEKAGLKPITDRVLYFFGRLDQKDDQFALVQRIIAGTQQVKAGAQMDRALDPISEYDHELKGWLDETNHCFWFIDKDMRDKTARLFTGV